MSDDEKYEEVWGVEFRKHDDEFGLNYESIRDDYVLVLTVIGGLLPVVGAITAFSSMAGAYVDRHDNDFHMDEYYWRAGVLALGAQIISWLVCIAVYLI